MQPVGKTEILTISMPLQKELGASKGVPILPPMSLRAEPLEEDCQVWDGESHFLRLGHA